MSLYVNNISGYVQEKGMETFTLHLISKEGLLNQNTRVIEKFVGKSIKELIDYMLKAVKCEEIDDIEETKGKINFIGNMRKPFTIAPMLASRAIPTDSKQNTAGFFFWQTRIGMRFKSIESLIKQESVAEYVYNRAVETAASAAVNFKKILSMQVINNANILGSARSGEYSTYRIFFNPHTFQFTQYDTSYAKKWSTMGGANLGTELADPPPVVDPEGENKFTKPYMAHRIISGVNATGCLEPKVDSTVVQPQTEDMSQAVWRYESLFSQVMTLQVAVNIKLMAGDKIECLFPQVSKDDDVDDLSLIHI